MTSYSESERRQSGTKAAYIIVFAMWAVSCIWAAVQLTPARHGTEGIAAGAVCGFAIAVAPLLPIALAREGKSRAAMRIAVIGFAGAALMAIAWTIYPVRF